MPLTPITGGGSFTRQNISQINANFAALSNPDLWVRPQNTYNSGAADGTYDKPFASLTAAAPSLRAGMVVGLLGVMRDEILAPLGVNDITIRGMANQPRQSTTSGVANGGGACWLSPSAGATSTTTALIRVRAQGWRFENIYFNNSATAAPAVMLFMDGGGDPPVDASAEHTSFYNCYFTGAIYGIRASGGPNFTTIDSCKFFGFGDSGDTAISNTVGAGVHSLYGWEIKNCDFAGNSRHIQASLNGASIHHNHFTYVNNGVTTAIFYDATGGLNNAVWQNAFDVDSGNGGIAAMFVLGTNDRFSANSLSTAVATTAFSWGDPA
jgi:hypothetical protein